jgi:hypothetical protein
MYIYYYLNKARKDPVRLMIRDGNGELLEEIEGTHTAGIHKVIWDTSGTDPGEYLVILQAGKISLEKLAIVREPWLWPAGNKGTHYK